MTLIEKKNTIGFVPNAIRIVERNQQIHSFISFSKRDLAFDLIMELYTYSSGSRSADMSMRDSLEYQKSSTTKTESSDSSL